MTALRSTDAPLLSSLLSEVEGKPLDVAGTLAVGWEAYLVADGITPLGYFLVAPVPGRPDVWQVHTVMTSCCRGKAALRAAREALATFQRDHPEAKRLVSYTTRGKPAPLHFAAALGWRVHKALPEVIGLAVNLN